MLKITLDLEKMLTLQKSVQILKKIISLLILDIFEEKSPNFMKFEWVTKKS